MQPPGRNRTRWVIRDVDELTIQAVKSLAASANQSVGYTLDQIVEYFGRKVEFDEDKPLKWHLPSDW